MWTVGSSALKMPAAPSGRSPAGWPPRLMAGRGLAALRDGGDQDEEALRFLAAHRGLVESEVQRYARRGGDREELGGEAWLALWEARQLHRADHHHTDLAHYARNHVHRRVRRAYLADLRRRARQPASVPPDVPMPGDPFEQVDDWMDVEKAWQALSPPGPIDPGRLAGRGRAWRASNPRRPKEAAPACASTAPPRGHGVGGPLSASRAS